MLRGRSAFVLFSFSILLYILGFLVLLVLGATDISEGLTSRQSVIIEFTPDLTPDQYEKFKNGLKSELDIADSEIEFISASQALELYRASDDAFEALDGENPFLPIAVLTIPKTTQLEEIEQATSAMSSVNDLIVDESYKPTYNNRIASMRTILIWLFVILLILVCMINYQFINLLLKDKRSTIDLMKLSGAFDHQIIRPFVSIALKDALLSSLVAVVMIGLTIMSVAGLRDLFQFVNTILIALSVLTIVILGIVIYTVSTYMIVKLYLKNN